VDLVTKLLIIPLLKELGVRWANSEGSIAEEHYFGAYLRNKLGARFHHHSVNQNGPLLVAACLPGEQHEVGLMLFCLSAMNQGFRLIYLGADTPFSELKIPAERAEADAILLAGSVEPDAKIFSSALSELVNIVKVPVFIGGKASIQHTDEIKAAGATPLGTDISQAIRKIEETVG